MKRKNFQQTVLRKKQFLLTSIVATYRDIPRRKGKFKTSPFFLIKTQ